MDLGTIVKGFYKCASRDFPGGPVAKTQCFSSRGQRFSPSLGSWDTMCCATRSKKTKKTTNVITVPNQLILRQITCCCSVIRLCLTFCNPMDCSTPGFPVLQEPWSNHRTFKAESFLWLIVEEEVKASSPAGLEESKHACGGLPPRTSCGKKHREPWGAENHPWSAARRKWGPQSYSCKAVNPANSQRSWRGTLCPRLEPQPSSSELLSCLISDLQKLWDSELRLFITTKFVVICYKATED